MGVAIFVDWENVQRSARSRGFAPSDPELVGALEGLIGEHLERFDEEVDLIVVAAPSNSLSGGDRAALRRANPLVVTPEVPKSTKNMADMVIAMSALHHWYAAGAGGVAIVSDDSDLQYLARELDRRDDRGGRLVKNYCLRDHATSLLRNTLDLNLSIGLALGFRLSPALGTDVDRGWRDAALYLRSIGAPPAGGGAAQDWAPLGPDDYTIRSSPAWKDLSSDLRARVDAVDRFVRLVGRARRAEYPGLVAHAVLALRDLDPSASGHLIRAAAAVGLIHWAPKAPNAPKDAPDLMMTGAGWERGLIQAMEVVVLRLHVYGRTAQQRVREELKKKGFHRDLWKHVLTALEFPERIGAVQVTGRDDKRHLQLRDEATFTIETVEAARRIMSALPRPSETNKGAVSPERLFKLVPGGIADPERWLETLTAADLMAKDPKQPRWAMTDRGKAWLDRQP